MTTILKILACWGVGSVALGLWIGPMLRLATSDFADRIGGLDGYSPITDRRFPVDAKIKSRHTANGILKQAGLPKAF